MIVDPARGREFLAAQLEELAPDDVEAREPLLAAMSGTVEVIATDDRTSDVAFLKLILSPGRRPLALFFSGPHRRASRQLLARLEAVLHERVDVWPADKPVKTRRSRRR